MNGSAELLDSPAIRAPKLFRHSGADAALVLLALLQGALLIAAPSGPLVALGLWWGSNTVAHCFLHRPFFSVRPLNTGFSLYLTALLGVPQSVWRGRHLAHHAGISWRPRFSARLCAELCVVIALWGTLAALAPAFFFAAYLPGYAAGLALCALHGRFEHRGGTRSCYGRIYNLLIFNDGYHCEHHARPGAHWTRLPKVKVRGARASRWPPVLRWVEELPACLLERLERVALRSTVLRRMLLRLHARAFLRLLPELEGVRTVGIVGGGLFPRTAIILEKLLPGARLTAIDGSARSLDSARPLLSPRVAVLNEWYDPLRHQEFDLLVFPLAYRGERRALYERPGAPLVVVHDWIWLSRGQGAVVSALLLKRLNLVRGEASLATRAGLELPSLRHPCRLDGS